MSGAGSKTKLKAMVVQTGARRGYALPRMLEQAGCLESFHTSLAFTDPPGGITSVARMLFPSRRATINRRTVREVPPSKVHSSLSSDIARFLNVRKSGSALTGRLAQSHQLGQRTIGRIDTAANVAFIVDDSGGPELMKALRAAGIPIAVDIVVTPMAHEQTAAAVEDWPNWKTTVYSTEERQRYLEMYDETVGLADLVMYPSEGVLEGLRCLSSFDESKSRHVPYALGAIDPLQPSPKQGRVFFAGSDPVRKGLPYLAAASKALRAEGRDYKFIIAGAIPQHIQELDDCSELQFLGHVSRDEMARQMSMADVFCLPSLAEGTAGVTLEALASGLPIVVTKSAGAPVTDRHNGLIVKERSVDDISTALVDVIEDRDLRQQLSANALAGRAEFSQAVVRQKLVDALSSLLPQGET